jgi:uncharacterized membrane protein YeiH
MFHWLEWMAVIASACFGVMLARSKRMDAVGVIAVAFIVAFGGGSLRDLLLDRHPLFWIRSSELAWAVFLVGLIGGLIPRIPGRLLSWLNLPDAMGLGLFSVLGVNYALQAGVSPFIASILGVITGSFGGVIGDVVCNDIPRLFRTGPLYATCSFAGCWVYLGLRAAGLDEQTPAVVGIASVVAFRLAALRWNLSLPESRGQ